MNQQLITKTLLEKRGEILNEIEDLEKSIKIYKENLVTLSKTIKIFDTSFDVLLPKIKKDSTVKKFASGELRRWIFDILKVENKPLSTTDLLQKIITKKNIEYVDGTDERNFQKSVLATLNLAYKSNLIDKVKSDGIGVSWKIKGLS